MGSFQKRCIFSSEIGRIWAQGCRRIDEQKQKSNKTRARNSLEACEWTDKTEPGGSHPEHKALPVALHLVGYRLSGKDTHLWVTPLSQHRRQNSQAPGGGQVENDLAVGGLFSHKALRLRTRAYSLICKGYFSSSVFHEWLSQDWQKPHMICRVFCPTARESKLPFSSSRGSLGMAVMIQQHRFSKRTDMVKLSPRFN